LILYFCEDYFFKKLFDDITILFYISEGLKKGSTNTGVGDRAVVLRISRDERILSRGFSKQANNINELQHLL